MEMKVDKFDDIMEAVSLEVDVYGPGALTPRDLAKVVAHYANLHDNAVDERGATQTATADNHGETQLMTDALRTTLARLQGKGSDIDMDKAIIDAHLWWAKAHPLNGLPDYLSIARSVLDHLQNEHGEAVKYTTGPSEKTGQRGRKVWSPNLRAAHAILAAVFGKAVVFKKEVGEDAVTIALSTEASAADEHHASPTMNIKTYFVRRSEATSLPQQGEESEGEVEVNSQILTTRKTVKLVNTMADAMTMAGFHMNTADMDGLLMNPSNNYEAAGRVHFMAKCPLDEPVIRHIVNVTSAAYAACPSSTEEECVAVADLLAKSKFNLMKCLDAPSLGKALATGLIPTEWLTKWAAPSSPAQNSIKSVKPSSSASTHGRAKSIEKETPAEHGRSRSRSPKRTTNSHKGNRNAARQPIGDAMDFWALCNLPVIWPKKRPGPEDFQLQAYADLRKDNPGSPLVDLAMEYDDIVSTLPAAKPQEAAAEYEFLCFHHEARTAKYLWWQELERCGIIVRRLVTSTADEAHSNSIAGVGSAGQQVVVTPVGTIVWLQGTGRLMTPNSKPSLNARLRAVFPMHYPFKDATNAVHKFPPPSKAVPFRR